MDDTNIVLHLKDGREVEVIYPHRVFIEYETPWLDKPGCLQTSTPVDDLSKYASGNDYSYGGRFVIGTWMPDYLTSKNRIETIPLSKVSCIIPASEEATEMGNRVRREEEERRRDKEYPKCCVTRKDLAEIFPDLAEKILTRPRT